jgi:curved DNA-binding protein CbpA
MPPVVRAQLDYYAALEITPAADTAAINAAFRRLAWRYHPDRNPAPGATLQFQDINEAHQVLFDPARRADYDAKWHPHAEEHRRPTRAPVQPQVRRHFRRHRQVRTALLTLFAVLFVSSAWVAIFAAMEVAHSGSSGYAFGSRSQFAADTRSDCGVSMEIIPITYTDARGRRATAWAADMHNCWGGTARVSSLPDPHPARFGAY